MTSFYDRIKQLFRHFSALETRLKIGVVSWKFVRQLNQFVKTAALLTAISQCGLFALTLNTNSAKGKGVKKYTYG